MKNFTNSKIPKLPTKQQGVILVIVLWFIALLIVMIGTLASQTRLSAKAAFYNKNGLQTWSDTLTAFNMAEMELMIGRMPPSPTQDKDVPLSERKNPLYRFDGRVLDLAYKPPETVTVRIYDHAGKINLRLLNQSTMRQILRNRIGDDLEKLSALDDAWQDWLDADDLKRMSGAEKEYYEHLSTPYEPRNGMLETVNELLLIKGFAEVFKGIELENAFTVYGTTQGINPNLATREALSLIPGASGVVDTILSRRRQKEFKTPQDFNEFMQPEQLALFLPWIHFSPSNFYTIAIQVNAVEKKEETDNTTATKDTAKKDKTEDSPTPETTSTDMQQAYMVTVQFKDSSQLPKVLLINPHGVLPDTRYDQPPKVEDKDAKSGDKPPANF